MHPCACVRSSFRMPTKLRDYLWLTFLSSPSHDPIALSENFCNSSMFTGSANGNVDYRRPNNTLGDLRTAARTEETEGRDRSDISRHCNARAAHTCAFTRASRDREKFARARMRELRVGGQRQPASNHAPYDKTKIERKNAKNLIKETSDRNTNDCGSSYIARKWSLGLRVVDRHRVSISIEYISILWSIPYIACSLKHSIYTI